MLTLTPLQEPKYQRVNAVNGGGPFRMGNDPKVVDKQKLQFVLDHPPGSQLPINSFLQVSEQLRERERERKEIILGM